MTHKGGPTVVADGPAGRTTEASHAGDDAHILRTFVTEPGPGPGPDSTTQPAPPVVAADAGRACEICGQRAFVHVRDGIGENIEHICHYCHACADAIHEQIEQAGRRRWERRIGAGSLLVFLGVLVVLLAASADFLGISGRTGFGWQQKLGVLLGGVCVLLGALFRMEPLALVGCILVPTAVFADRIGVGRAYGIGERQKLVLIVAAAVMALGLLIRRQRRPRS